ncbi:hypothetical protein ACJ73_08865 [Blastomyces percursus]|uniref:BTB domain-containing protein n=1 Tax=Blastomyces percursus TaxID=1658174 RepID=A0A1J9QKD2_9EURO|nr:hypothetical protein ACJ73_08865 [Blastomyces percursus]
MPNANYDMRRPSATSSNTKGGNTASPQDEIMEIHSQVLEMIKILNRMSAILEMIETEFRHFGSTDYADTTIYIGSVKLPAHKLVLATQSEYFSKAFRSSFVEGETGKFRFENGNGHAYWRVFEYMYTGKYSESPATGLAIEDDTELMRHARVYSVADMFLMEGLKAKALVEFESKLTKFWLSESFLECI